MVEGACLENRFACKRNGGSNPSLTAKRNAAGRVSDRLFLDSGGGQACLDDVRGRKQPGDLGHQLHSMLCRAPRRAFRDSASGRRPRSGIPVSEGWPCPAARDGLAGEGPQKILLSGPEVLFIF